MEEQINPIEIVEIKSTKYVLLSIGNYTVLNDKISDAMGFDVGKPTERYAPIEPMMAKINIKFTEVGEEVVESYDTIQVMPITATVQEQCQELLQGYELIESYVTYVENVQL